MNANELVGDLATSKDSSSRLSLSAYQQKAILADRNKSSPFAFHLLGLFGEAGSLLSVAKKKQRDKAYYADYAPAVIEELGDVLWYLAVVAKRGGIDFSEIGHNIDKGYADWVDGKVAPLLFASLQPAPTMILLQPTLEFEETLIELASDVGKVLTEHQAGALENNRAALSGCLVSVMRRLIKAANGAGISLEEAAQKNLDKIFDRWPQDKKYPAPLDDGAEGFEKLPRNLVIEIFEREVSGRKFVFQRSYGIYIGDRLTDNATEPDDYRFHDVFHYAYAAVLSWSPVTRALLHYKRKSQPQIDEVEDGARAILIEEGIVSWIFSQAKSSNYFADIKPGELSFDLLKHVKGFVKGYEGAKCPLWLWEEAILQGFSAFRFLKEHRRGRIYIDMENRKLTIEKTSP